jgi:hypothetical protein
MPQLSQQQANYRDGDPKNCCGYCRHFNGQQGVCDAVAGPITPFMMSDIYDPYPNPRKGTYDITPKNNGASPAEPAEAEPPSVRIGGKSY